MDQTVDLSTATWVLVVLKSVAPLEVKKRQVAVGNLAQMPGNST